jgi:hypothetical protein
MHIAHIYIEHKKAVKPEKLAKRQQRVRLWMSRQYRKEYDKAIKEFDADIKEIQKTIPGWLPEFTY